MAEWIVEVTRRVRLAVPAACHADAIEAALAVAWEWLPEQADGGDQGAATACVMRSGDLAGRPHTAPSRRG